MIFKLDTPGRGDSETGDTDWKLSEQKVTEQSTKPARTSTATLTLSAYELRFLDAISSLDLLARHTLRLLRLVKLLLGDQPRLLLRRARIVVHLREFTKSAHATKRTREGKSAPSAPREQVRAMRMR